MSARLGALVGQYRSRGVLVDTNILLLLFVGSYDPAWIARFKRTGQFDTLDYQLVVNFLAKFERWITTPHVLTKVSNLGGQLPHPQRRDFYMVFKALLERFFEIHTPAIAVSQLPEFPRLALTDIGIEVVARGQCLVLTDDGPFSGYLAGAGVDAIRLRDPT